MHHEASRAARVRCLRPGRRGSAGGAPGRVLAITLAFLPFAASATTSGPEPPRGLADSDARAVYRLYSRALQTPDLSWEDRVLTLRRRGVLLSDRFLLEPALADFNAAAALAPHFSVAHLDVAVVYTKLGRYPQAYAAYKRAFQANPANLLAFMSRGMTYYLDGRYARARRDLQRYLKFHPDDARRTLWLYLAMAREGRDARGELARRAAGLPPGRWPAPLVDLALGKRTEADILAEVEGATGAGAPERRVEAYWFLAEWHLARGEEGAARKRYRSAVATGVKSHLEYASARNALALAGD